MAELVLTTWDWVPNEPRGYVRDLRVRWALEEAGLPYRVESVSPHDRERHMMHQPFGQVPSQDAPDGTPQSAPYRWWRLHDEYTDP